MDSEPQSHATPPASPARAAGPPDRSTDRPVHTPRAARSGDHLGRPGALPPAPGRLQHAALPVALAVVLTLISWQVAVDGPLLAVDTGTRGTVRDLHHVLHSTLLNHLGAFLSDLGGGVPAVPVLLLAAGLAAHRRRRSGADRWWIPLPVAAVAALLIPALVVPAKAWFARPGPYGEPLAPGQWGWYPSGHTATSSIAYGAAALLLGGTAGAAARARLLRATALLCAGVGLGLVWCDYHWLLDVTASWCLAGLVLWCLDRVLRRLRADGGGDGRGGGDAPPTAPAERHG